MHQSLNVIHKFRVFINKKMDYKTYIIFFRFLKETKELEFFFTENKFDFFFFEKIFFSALF